jgi:hypothetical protein
MGLIILMHKCQTVDKVEISWYDMYEGHVYIGSNNFNYFWICERGLYIINDRVSIIGVDMID